VIAIDSNVWIYYCDTTTPEHERVRKPVRSVLRTARTLVNSVVPLEVTHYLTKRGKSAGRSRFEENFLHVENIVVQSLEERDVIRSRQLLEEHHATEIGGRDASLVATMETQNVGELWTHDTGLKRLGEYLDWMTVVDPVETGRNETGS
jgi:predicted nucleic acid-binding protein